MRRSATRDVLDDTLIHFYVAIQLADMTQHHSEYPLDLPSTKYPLQLSFKGQQTRRPACQSH